MSELINPLSLSETQPPPVESHGGVGFGARWGKFRRYGGVNIEATVRLLSRGRWVPFEKMN